MRPEPRTDIQDGGDPPDSRDDDALLDRARALAVAFQGGEPGMPLRGKMLCVLCDDCDGEAARLFASAANELGAHVACVRVGLSDRSSAIVVRETAALFARLYEAVECIDVSPALVRRLRESGAIPFFAGAATAGHRTAALASRLGGDDTTSAENRRRILQALLIRATA